MTDAEADRARDRLDHDVALAWHTAAFSRVKRLRPLSSVLGLRHRAPLPEPTQAERVQIVAAADRFAAELRARREQGGGG